MHARQGFVRIKQCKKGKKIKREQNKQGRRVNCTTLYFCKNSILMISQENNSSDWKE